MVLRQTSKKKRQILTDPEGHFITYPQRIESPCRKSENDNSHYNRHPKKHLREIV